MKVIKVERSKAENEIIASKIEKKRENAKKRRLQTNADNAERLTKYIEFNQDILPQIIADRDKLEQMIAQKTLHKQLAEKKREYKSMLVYIGSLTKTRNRNIPKPDNAAAANP